MPRAEGTFEVTLTPQESSGASGIGRAAVDKTITGDLAGTSHGMMLSVTTAVDGSAGYVALEWIRGTLHGRAGSFALIHRGIKERGAFTLERSVVPDSGTDALTGIRGTFTATALEGKKHSYVLEYELEPGEDR